MNELEDIGQLANNTLTEEAEKVETPLSEYQEHKHFKQATTFVKSTLGYAGFATILALPVAKQAYNFSEKVGYATMIAAALVGGAIGAVRAFKPAYRINYKNNQKEIVSNANNCVGFLKQEYN